MDVKRSVPLLLSWFGENARDLPWRRTNDPYAIWVSEIMLQQTQVKTVMPYWSRWMRAFPTISALAKAPQQRLHKLWEGLGYYHRVRNMQRAAIIICERHQGIFPERYEDILELPGIGRYTAGAICSIAFNQATPILDGNVIRVLSRVFFVRGDPQDRKVKAKLWALAAELVQEAKQLGGNVKVIGSKPGTDYHVATASALNQSLMELGALVCTPKGTQCDLCPLRGACQARQRGCVTKLPQLAPRARPTQRHFVGFVMRRGGKILVQQRPAGVVNAHLWEFPNVEVTDGTRDVKAAANLAVGAGADTFERLCVIRHSITRYRMTLELFKGTLPQSSAGDAKAGREVGRRGSRPYEAKGEWVSLMKAARLPFASAHKKGLDFLRAG